MSVNFLPPDIAAAFDVANGAFNAGRHVEALAQYEALHRIHPAALTAYGRALALASLERRPEALPFYEEAVRRNPRFVEARVNLANALREEGDLRGALHHHLVALGAGPTELISILNIGIDWARLGEDAAARHCFGLVRARAPTNVLAAHELARLPRAAGCAMPLPLHLEHDYQAGVALANAGSHAAAAEKLAAVVAAEPLSAVAWIDYGNALLHSGRAEAAAAAQRRACEIDPANFAARHNLGAALAAVEPAQAIEPYQAAITLNPGFALTWRMLGAAHAALGDLPRAWDCLAICCALDGAPDEAFADLASYSRALRRPEEAIAAMKTLVDRAPDSFVPHDNLGAFLLDERRLDEALTCFHRALELDPNSAVARTNIGCVMELRGRHSEALNNYRAALDLAPDNPQALTRVLHAAQHQCDWRGIEDLFERVRNLARVDDFVSVAPFSLLAIPGVSAADQLACSKRYAEQNYGALRKLAAAPVALPRPGEKIRIGYLSSDLHDHATSWLLAEIVELHDRRQFEVVAYSYGDVRSGPMRERLLKSFDLFRDVVERTDEEVAALIRQDRIHVLVDLKGYTQGTRSGVLALRPSPVQINYLGYPGSLGADYVDFIVADGVVIPPELEGFYSERVLRLPHCYQPNDRKRPRPPAVSRAEAGLPEQAFVFAAFNNVYKITPDVFDLWCGLLRDLPSSVLWVLSSNEDANRNLRAEAEKRGVDPARIITAPRRSLADHLARFACADLMLDTFPCTAHTTASDSLWAGVPVLTCMGDTFASRVAASILAAAGLGELAAPDLTAYAEMGRRIATDPGLAAELKQRACASRDGSPLFDSQAYTRGLEKAYVEAVRLQRETPVGAAA